MSKCIYVYSAPKCFAAPVNLHISAHPLVLQRSYSKWTQMDLQNDVHLTALLYALQHTFMRISMPIWQRSKILCSTCGCIYFVHNSAHPLTVQHPLHCIWMHIFCASINPSGAVPTYMVAQKFVHQNNTAKGCAKQINANKVGLFLPYKILDIIMLIY